MMELFESLAKPVIWILALLVLGLILTGRLPKKKRYRLGRCALFLGIGLLFLLSSKPASELLVYSLECQYPLPSDEVLSTIDVVVILGGGVNLRGGFPMCSELSGPAYSRLVNGVRVFKQSEAETLALSGGGLEESEAEVMKALAMELGVPENRIIVETRSRNTMENGAKLAELISSTKTQNIGLVTSALHMPRSVRVFREQFPDDVIVPVPVNHLYLANWGELRSYIPSSGRFQDSHNAIHEWIGMVWYAIRY